MSITVTPFSHSHDDLGAQHMTTLGPGVLKSSVPTYEFETLIRTLYYTFCMSFNEKSCRNDAKFVYDKYLNITEPMAYYAITVETLT